MADNTERLVVEADVTDLKKGAEALDDFAEKAEEAGAAADDLSGKVKRIGDVFGSIADPIDENGKAVEGLQRNYKGLTISQGEYTNAMRMLPAQLTDVVTQLAGGQNPLLILIQQGGQVKDSFGGLSNTFKILKEAITPASLAFAAVAVSIGAMGYAAYKSGQQFDEVAKSVILMGGAGFRAMDDLTQAADQIAAKTGTSVASVTENLVALNNQGRATGAQMKVMAAAMAEMSKAGIDSKTALSDFNAILKDPVKGMADLNEQYGFVTEAQAKYIIGLNKQGDKEKATTEAVKLFSDAMTQRSKDIVEATDNIGQFWQGLKTTASDAFGAIGITLRAWGNQIIDMFKLLELSIANFFSTIVMLDGKISGFIADSVTAMVEAIPGASSIVDLTGINKWGDEVKKAGEEAKAEMVKQSTEFSRISNKLFAWDAQGVYEAEARSASGVKATGTDQKSRDAVSQMAKDSEKKAKADKVSVDLGNQLLEQYQAQQLSLAAQIDVLKNRKDYQLNMSAQMKDYLTLQSKINILEGIQADTKGRALTKNEQSLLANKEQVLAAAKQVGQQGEILQSLQKQAQLSDELAKAHTNTAAQIQAIADGWGKSAREQERMLQLQTRASNLRAAGGTDEQVAQAQKDMSALWEAQDSKTQDWVGGIKTGMEDFAKTATDYASIAKNAVGAAFGGMTDAMTSFLTTGKVDMKSFTVDMLKMIVQIINQWLVLKAIQGIGSMVGGSFGQFTAGLGGGGAAAASAAAPAAFSMAEAGISAFSAFAAPVALAAASPLASDAGIATPKIMSANNSASQGSTAQSGTSIAQIVVNVDSSGNATSSSNGGALGRAYAAVINDSVQAGIEKAMKPGGTLFMDKHSRG